MSLTVGKLLKRHDPEDHHLGNQTISSSQKHVFKPLRLRKREIKTTQNYLLNVLIKRIAVNKFNVVDG